MEKYGISFKEMDKKQKVKHIWTYYRYHIIAGIIACFMIFNFGKTIICPETPKDVEVVMVGPLLINDEKTL